MKNSNLREKKATTNYKTNKTIAIQQQENLCVCDYYHNNNYYYL